MDHSSTDSCCVNLLEKVPNMSRNQLMTWLLVTGFVVLNGCAPAIPVGPPELRLGRDECAECKMSIVDQRCAGCLLVGSPDGVEAVVFDDIGCMLDYMKANTTLKVTSQFVRDYQGKAWLPAESASFLVKSSAHTAMGSGIIAFLDESHARASMSDFRGSVASWGAVVASKSSD